MTFSDTGTYQAWAGHAVLDSTGQRVGKVSHIYVDDRTGQPEWLAVHTGFFKDHSAFVPLRGARAEGDRLVVAYDRDMIKQSPSLDEVGQVGTLKPGDEEELLGYYAGGTLESAEAGASDATVVQEVEACPELGSSADDPSPPEAK